MTAILLTVMLISLCLALVLIGRKKSSSVLLALFSLTSLLLFYFEPIGLGSYSQVETRYVLEEFFSGNKNYREENREKIAIEVSRFVLLKANSPSEIYMLAKRMKSLEEFRLSRLAYAALYQNNLESMDGDILAEYSQILYFDSGRVFTDEVKESLEMALLKNSTNPVALTLKGLSFFQEGNLEGAIGEWTKALDYISDERERNELKGAIKALKTRKNQ